jgi:hypothetical protein
MKRKEHLMTRTFRTTSLLATLLASFVVASAALGFTGAHSAHDHTTAQAISPQELKLRSDMRKLWEDHITWTRLAVISLTTGSPDTNATVARLLRNQADIGNAIKPYFGKAAGNELTRLLREHITIAAELITAAKEGDQAKAADAQARWQTNADRIAAFLNKANPVAWKLGEMRAMMRSHLRLTTQEVVARLQQRWNADIAAYEKIHRQILGMADMLSGGIVAHFPARFQ